MDWFNPIEWFAWLYGKVFQNHFYYGAVSVVVVFGLLGYVLWIRGVDKYKEEHPQQTGRQETDEAPKPQAVTQNETPKQTIPATAKPKIVSHKKKKAAAPVALTAPASPKAPSVGFIGGRQSLLRDTTVEGFDIAVDQSQSDTGIVDHSILKGPGKSRQPDPTTPPGIDNAAKKDKDASGDSATPPPTKPPTINMRGASHVIWDQSIIEGTFSAEGSDHVAFINGILMSDAEGHRARMNNLNILVMRKIRDMRVHHSWVSSYLARVRSNFEGVWRTSLSADQQEQNEELFTQFEDVAKADTLDEKKCVALFDKIAEATPTPPAPLQP